MNNQLSLHGRRILRAAVATGALSLIVPTMAATAQTTTTTAAATAETTAPAADSAVADTAAVPSGGVSAGYGGTAGNNGGFGVAGVSLALAAVVSAGVFLGLKKKRNAAN